MSQTSLSTPTNVTESQPVSSLTLVVLLLIPCVVILLLLNCLFLGYKILILSKKNKLKPQDTEELFLPRIRLSEVVRDGRGAYMSLSEPVLLHQATSSRTSSKERTSGPLHHRIRLLRPDGETGSLRVPSTIQAPSSAGWCRSAPVLVQTSDSDAETRLHLVPPNSPMETEYMGRICRSSTHERLAETSHPFDKVMMECEFTEPSAEGSGLDSDFGASAGVSLRILSADSDGLSNGVLTSALEWDYYDPCYVKQNNIPKHNHRPAVHTKQYWV